MNISEHFTLSEMIRTSQPMDNLIDPDSARNLITLADTLLEPIRALLNSPLVVHSGFRSHAVNAAVGGDPKSAHLEGRACDFHPVNMVIRRAFDLIRHSDIPYDKLILEEKRGRFWIHVQIPRDGNFPRRIALTAQMGDAGKMVYMEAV